MGLGDFFQSPSDYIFPGSGMVIDYVTGGPAQRAQQEANRLNRDINAQNVALQKEFAQNSIRWRVEDAKAAGIHPLAALGASGAQFSPNSIPVGVEDPGDPIGRGLDLLRAGQNVSRSMMATMTQEERQLQQLRMAREMAEIELIHAQTLNLQKPNNPPMPGNYPPGVGLDGQGDVYRTPQRKVAPHATKPYSEPGTITDVGWADTPTGLAPVPSSDVKERIEDQIIQEVMWSVRNQLQPTMSFGHWGARPPWEQMKKRWPDATGYHYHPFKQEWQPVFKRRDK